MSIKLPSFGETVYKTDIANRNTEVTVFQNAEKALYEKYLQLFLENGYRDKQSYAKNGHFFSALSLGDEGVFLNFFEGLKELYIVVEQNCKYFAWQDAAGAACVMPQITQIGLEDFGLCYTMRLEDGRFIVLDGGWGFAPEIDRLYESLRAASPHEKPIVAVWVLTHPHPDHYLAFLRFVEKYGEATVIQNVFYNFPEADDTAHYPALADDDARFTYNVSATYNVPFIFDAVKKCNAELIEIHTGQTYRIGEAMCEVLSSMDDTIHCSSNINAISTVLRVELAGQVILWTSDMVASAAAIAEKYGIYLKCDILQMPHHGFGSGTSEAEIAFYQNAAPSVCLLPVSDYNAYTCFCGYERPTEFAFRELNADELITGEQTRMLELPYTASKNGKALLERSVLNGRDNAGAATWVFTDLFTGSAEDCCFTILNMTNANAEVMMDIYFEDNARNLRFIQAIVKGQSMRRVHIFQEGDVNADAVYFNWMSLKEHGVPENALFSVRFVSNIPVIVSNKNHTAAYHSQNR